MIRNVGPFRVHHVKDKFLDIWLRRYSDIPFGWGYGYDDYGTSDRPWVQFRIGKLSILYIDEIQISFMGFWIIFRR